MQRLTEILRLHCLQTSTRSDAPPPREIYKDCGEKLRGKKDERKRAQDGAAVQLVEVAASQKRNYR